MAREAVNAGHTVKRGRAAARRPAGRGFTLGRLFGIEVGLDPSWFVIFLLVTWSLAGHYLMVNAGWSGGLRLTLAVVTALLFFASVLAHEFGHSLVANALGAPVKRITLFIFGGMAHLSREPKRARDEFLIAIAGPLVSLALAAGFGLLWLLGERGNLATLAALGFWLGWINLTLALFNLIPGFPLDGGRVLRAVIWGISGNAARATRVAAAVGQGVAFLLLGFGLWQFFGGAWVNGLWLAFIGWFLYSAASSSVRQLALQDLLQGHAVREVMMLDCPRISPDTSVQALVDEAILPSGRRCFPVVVGSAFLGLVTLHQVKALPRERWPTTTVAEAMIPAEQLLTLGPDDELGAAFERMTAEEVNQLPVVEDGRFVGMVTREKVLGFLRSLTELS